MLPLNEILEKINPKERTELSQEEFYLGLVIGERKVQAGIWNFSKEGGESLAYGSVESWGGENAEELIVAADTSIASSVAALPEIGGSQPTKVILGLPDSWVEGDGIKKDKLDVLQTVCKKLLLKPLGFVITPEAIAHLFKKREGGAPSVILVSLDETEITVSLIFQGKFLGSKVVGRSNSLAMDLEEGLLRFNFQGELPSRIIIVDGKDLEEEKQSLISYPWVGPDGEKKLSFLQFPKVELAEENFEISAVILSGSWELSKKKLPEPAKPEQGEKEAEPAFPENDFGFVKGEDILAAGVKPAPEVSEEEVAVPEVPELPAKRVKRLARFDFLAIVKKIVFPFRRLLQLFLHKIFLALVILAVVFLAGGLLAFKLAAKAEVRLFVHPQQIEKEFEFTVSSKTDSVDREKMIIPAKEISVDVSGNKSAEVTGKKTVGDKAKGEVTIYNRTDQVKTLPKGTVLKGSAGLKFLLDEEVKVASKTADLAKYGPVDKWGEANVKITAEDIGAQYNLAADSPLSFETFSSSVLMAKFSSAPSGGSSREIQAVSKEDRDNLQKALNKELEENAREQIKAKVSSPDHLLESSIGLKSKTDRFDKEVGDEDSLLNLEEKAVYSALFFKEDDLKLLVEKEISSARREGYQSEPVKEEKNVEEKDKDKGVYLVRVKQDYLPDVDTAKIARGIKGKKTDKAESWLGSQNQVAGVDIKIGPKPFSWLKFLPLNESRITIKVETI